jgi:hypothetical protein
MFVLKKPGQKPIHQCKFKFTNLHQLWPQLRVHLSHPLRNQRPTPVTIPAATCRTVCRQKLPGLQRKPRILPLLLLLLLRCRLRNRLLLWGTVYWSGQELGF